MRRLSFILPSLLILAAFSGCAVFRGVNWDSQQLANAAAKTITAMAITDDQVVAMCQLTAHEMDSAAVIDEGEYIARLERLMKKVRKVDGYSFNLKVYVTEEINAFAMADGSIRVYSGLMDVMDDAQLMAIIGHEIGHVVHEDSKNAMKKAYLASAARDVIGAAGTLGSVSSALLGDLGEAYVQAQFSQTQEYAADEYGFNFAISQGYSPYSMSLSLEKLLELSSGASMSRLEQMFSSHPDTELRAERTRQMADEYSKGEKNQ